MARVDVAFERLHPVALALIDLDARALGHQGLEVGQRRRSRPAPEIGPDDPVPLHARIRDGPHLVLEAALRRLARHVDAGAALVELPAVIDAAQAVFLVAPVEEAGAAVRAGVLDEPDRARGDAEGDEVLAEEADPDGRAALVRQLARQPRGHPVLAHERAHGCPRPDAAEQLIVLATQHGRLPRRLTSSRSGIIRTRPAKSPSGNPARARRRVQLRGGARGSRRGVLSVR